MISLAKYVILHYVFLSVLLEAFVLAWGRMMMWPFSECKSHTTTTVCTMNDKFQLNLIFLITCYFQCWLTPKKLNDSMKINCCLPYKKACIFELRLPNSVRRKSKTPEPVCNSRYFLWKLSTNFLLVQHSASKKLVSDFKRQCPHHLYLSLLYFFYCIKNQSIQK